MATAATPKTEPKLEVIIKNAVKAWVKAEQSAIWNLIKAVYQGLQGVYGPDRDTREKSLRTWINQAFEEEYGPGAAKDRAAHISKVFKIALNAKDADFKKWEKEGTGFYKAYEKFAVPQASPADKKKPDVITVPTGAGQVITVTEGGATETVTITGAGKEGVSLKEAAAQTGPVDVDAEIQKKMAASPEPKGAPVFTDSSGSEMTQLWADRIDTNKKMWTWLLEHLTNPKRMTLTPDMVVETVVAVGKKPALLRSVVGLLLQNEKVAKEIVAFINENPTLVAAKV